MRFVLFYESTESFNYFTDEIAKELSNRGHDTFILDLLNPSRPSHSMQGLMTFCSQKVDAIICFNRAGIHNDTDLCFGGYVSLCNSRRWRMGISSRRKVSV